MSFNTSLPRPAQASYLRFLRDTRGVAAIEFAIVMPLLVLMLLGTVELARAIDADRRFGNATAVTADLVAREQTLTDADLDGMMNSITHLMSPYDGTALSLGITAVRKPINPDEQPKVEWSYKHGNQTVLEKGATYPSLPADLVSPGGRVIIVESTFNFALLFLNWSDNPFRDRMSSGIVTLTDKATLTPRSDCVHNTTHESSASRCDFAMP